MAEKIELSFTIPLERPVKSSPVVFFGRLEHNLLVHKEILSSISALFKREIERNPELRAFHVLGVDPQLLKLIRMLIYHSKVAVDSAQLNNIVRALRQLEITKPIRIEIGVCELEKIIIKEPQEEAYSSTIQFLESKILNMETMNHDIIEQCETLMAEKGALIQERDSEKLITAMRTVVCTHNKLISATTQVHPDQPSLSGAPANHAGQGSSIPAAQGRADPPSNGGVAANRVWQVSQAFHPVVQARPDQPSSSGAAAKSAGQGSSVSVAQGSSNQPSSSPAQANHARLISQTPRPIAQTPPGQPRSNVAAGNRAGQESQASRPVAQARPDQPGSNGDQAHHMYVHKGRVVEPRMGAPISQAQANRAGQVSQTPCPVAPERPDQPRSSVPGGNLAGQGSSDPVTQGSKQPSRSGTAAKRNAQASPQYSGAPKRSRI